MRRSTLLQILMSVFMAIALAGIVGCTPKMGQSSQALCADNQACQNVGESCSAGPGQNFVCDGIQYDPGPPCVLNGACTVTDSVCQDACGQPLYCWDDLVYHDAPGNVSCSGSGGAGGSGGAAQGGQAGAPPAGGSGGMSGGSGGQGGSPLSCVDQNEETACLGFSEGYLLCNGELTCHCGYWLLTSIADAYLCNSGQGGGGSGGSMSSGGAGGMAGSGGVGGMSGGSGGQGGAIPPLTCLEGNACLNNSTSMWEYICFDVSDGEFLRCCGNVLVLSSLNMPCPSGSGGAGGAAGSGGVGGMVLGGSGGMAAGGAGGMFSGGAGGMGGGGSGGSPSMGNVEFRWTPPASYVQNGEVKVVGQADLGVSGIEDHWDDNPPLNPEFCNMALANGTYSCFTDLPPDTLVDFNIFHVDASCTTYGGGWLFDEGTYACGACIGGVTGCGQTFGTYQVLVNGVASTVIKAENYDGLDWTWNGEFMVP